MPKPAKPSLSQWGPGPQAQALPVIRLTLLWPRPLAWCCRSVCIICIYFFCLYSLCLILLALPTEVNPLCKSQLWRYNVDGLYCLWKWLGITFAKYLGITISENINSGLYISRKADACAMMGQSSPAYPDVFFSAAWIFIYFNALWWLFLIYFTFNWWLGVHFYLYHLYFNYVGYFRWKFERLVFSLWEANGWGSAGLDGNLQPWDWVRAFSAHCVVSQCLDDGSWRFWKGEAGIVSWCFWNRRGWGMPPKYQGLTGSSLTRKGSSRGPIPLGSLSVWDSHPIR